MIKREDFEATVLTMLDNNTIIGSCDNCNSPNGVLQLDPYYKEIHELILIKSLCDKCRQESIEEC